MAPFASSVAAELYSEDATFRSCSIVGTGPAAKTTNQLLNFWFEFCERWSLLRPTGFELLQFQIPVVFQYCTIELYKGLGFVGS